MSGKRNRMHISLTLMSVLIAILALGIMNVKCIEAVEQIIKDDDSSMEHQTIHNSKGEKERKMLKVTDVGKIKKASVLIFMKMNPNNDEGIFNGDLVVDVNGHDYSTALKDLAKDGIDPRWVEIEISPSHLLEGENFVTIKLDTPDGRNHIYVGIDKHTDHDNSAFYADTGAHAGAWSYDVLSEATWEEPNGEYMIRLKTITDGARENLIKANKP